MALADDMRAKIEAGQAATATAVRTLADQIERLSLGDASEVLNWLALHSDALTALHVTQRPRMNGPRPRRYAPSRNYWVARPMHSFT